MRKQTLVEPIYEETLGRLEWYGLLNICLGCIQWRPGLHTEVAIWLPNVDLAGESLD